MDHTTALAVLIGPTVLLPRPIYDLRLGRRSIEITSTTSTGAAAVTNTGAAATTQLARLGYYHRRGSYNSIGTAALLLLLPSGAAAVTTIGAAIVTTIGTAALLLLLPSGAAAVTTIGAVATTQLARLRYYYYYHRALQLQLNWRCNFYFHRHGSCYYYSGLEAATTVCAAATCYYNRRGSYNAIGAVAATTPPAWELLLPSARQVSEAGLSST